MGEISVRLLYQEYKEKLKNHYPSAEAENLAIWLLEAFLKVQKKDLIGDIAVSEVPVSMSVALENLLRGQPIQYVLGEADFYGRKYVVGPEVLIPRNETEELVHLVLKEGHYGKKKILDIGTGSGCIAISLALEMREAEVFALDLSPDALKLAGQNAAFLGAGVTFFRLDVLSDPLPVTDLDIVVSNPPYVRESEKSGMHSNVLEHEPYDALFVSDEDPLIFYKTIVEKAYIHLKKEGTLYFEINEAFGKEIKCLVEEGGFIGVKIYQDLNGKDRIVWGRKP